MREFEILVYQVWPLLNILNEVCHGIKIDNFEEIIGSKKSIVIELMDRISKEDNENVIMLNLSVEDLEVLNKSFDFVFNQIEDWEFQTRIGITKSEVNKIRLKLNVV